MSNDAVKSKKIASKNAFRRNKKKLDRSQGPTEPVKPTADGKAPAPEEGRAQTATSSNGAEEIPTTDPMAVENPVDLFELDLDNPLAEEFAHVFEKFEEPTEEEAVAKKEGKAEVYYSDDDVPEEEEDTKRKMSKKQRKMLNTMSVAHLKSSTNNPELVEWVDVSSSDPKLLLELKAVKNAIPVPAHWSLKREYLSSKRGIEKPPFVLPKFIQETGIMEMREIVLEKQDQMSMRQKQRERVQGKVGKLDIDYAKLYDAFFRRQTKPEMTKYGEVYYEGKEFEANLVDLKPGELTEELREALGMPPGHPPPWLINMQRFGPPASYPNLRVPGVNAPIPPGASWGFVPGQWGKPPVDDYNKPLWGGDVFGSSITQQQVLPTHHGLPVERGIWGWLRPEGESEDEESDEDEEEDNEEDDDEEGGQSDATGLHTSFTTASAMQSEAGGVESIAGDFTLRKQRKGIETEEPGAPRSAYQVLPEKDIKATGFFGGEHAYDLNAARRDGAGYAQRKRKAGDVDISVDVDKLEGSDRLDKDILKQEYESKQRAEAQGQWQSIDQDDLADMIAAESRKRVKRDDHRRGR